MVSGCIALVACNNNSYTYNKGFAVGIFDGKISCPCSRNIRIFLRSSSGARRCFGGGNGFTASFLGKQLMVIENKQQWYCQQTKNSCPDAHNIPQVCADLSKDGWVWSGTAEIWICAARRPSPMGFAVLPGEKVFAVARLRQPECVFCAGIDVFQMLMVRW